MDVKFVCGVTPTGYIIWKSENLFILYFILIIVI